MREVRVRIGALQKTGLLDFPGKVSAIVFTQGCNFLCPYCHNSSLVLYRENPLSYAEVLGFLTQRRRFLEGVVITGGEPTLQDDLAGFCSILKSLGYALKLDTNGSKPDVLRHLLDLGLLDYVAMDIKTAPRCYPPEIAPQNPGAAIMESMALLRESGVSHEFRVTCAAPFVTVETFQEILAAVQGHAPIFLQKARLENVLEPSFFLEKGCALDAGEIEALRLMADDFGAACAIR